MAITMRPNSMVMISDDTMYAEFNCGDASELSGFDSWNNIDLADGCVTLCIPTGVFYVIYGGSWYNSDGSDAPDNVAASLNALPSLLGGLRTSVINQTNEIEISEPKGGGEDER